MVTDNRDPMIPTTIIRFREDVAATDFDGGIVLVSPRGEPRLDAPTPGLVATVHALTTSGATEKLLSDIVVQQEGPGGLAHLYFRLRQWGERCLLRYTLTVGEIPLLSLEPMVEGWRFESPQLPPEGRFRLSRFASVRCEREALILESPLSTVRITLPGPHAVALLGALAQPSTCVAVRQIAENLGQNLSEETVEAFIGLLVVTGMVGEVGDDGRLAEDRDPTLAQWEPHDLRFHARARRGRHDSPTGATYRFLGSIPPLPAVKPTMPGPNIPLAVPDLDRLRHSDPRLTAALEDRRSIRAYGGLPIAVCQLGELLYRVARVRTVGAVPPPGSERYQLSDRVYPSGGAVYDLELYVVVNRCTDLDGGLYHYDAERHTLAKLAGPSGQVQELLRDAERAAALECPSQVLLVLASRFQRVSWKYSGSAYALILKNVGVLYQSIYLVATAMGLAPCALGSGNSDLFARAAGLDYFAETSVGEILLGSLP